MVYPPHHPWAYSSAGEHYIDIVGVTGSIPVTPTMDAPEIIEKFGFRRLGRGSCFQSSNHSVIKATGSLGNLVGVVLQTAILTILQN
jgi:hypothetical protein